MLRWQVLYLLQEEGFLSWLVIPAADPGFQGTWKLLRQKFHIYCKVCQVEIVKKYTFLVTEWKAFNACQIKFDSICVLSGGILGLINVEDLTSLPIKRFLYFCFLRHVHQSPIIISF